MRDIETTNSLGALAWLSRFPDRFQRKVSQGAYRPEIDGLRFFAIAFVIFGHSLERAARFFPSYQNNLSGTTLELFLQLAPIGVGLFFAISGFILANQAMKAESGPLSGAFLKSYFGRRVMRIEPPYVVLLVATWALISLSGYVPEGTHRFDVEPRSLNVSLIASIFYVHDIVWGNFPRLFPPGWSLEVEVQFYLLAPLLFWLWTRMASAGSRVAWASAFLLGGIIFGALDIETAGPLHVRYSLLHYFTFFWMGIVMAYAKEALAPRMAALPAFVSTAIGWAGLALCVAMPTIDHAPALPEAFRLFGVSVGLAAVFASTFAPLSGFRAFCARPWISLIGGACYSIYLVHLQILQVFSTLLFKLAPKLPLAGVAAAFAFASLIVVAVGLTYYVQVERRFMTRNWHLAFAAWLKEQVATRAPALVSSRVAVGAGAAILAALAFGLARHV